MKILIGVVLILILIITIAIYFYANKPANVFQDYIYLDNNGTTEPYDETLRALVKYGKLGNASASYGDAAKNVINNADTVLKNWLMVPDYHVIYTSGASESNDTVLKAGVEDYWMRFQQKPHIILTAYEHKTSMDCAMQLYRNNRCDVDFISPTRDGSITTESVITAIKPNTYIISIIAVHNELGVINPVNDIFKQVKLMRPNIICHTDLTQSLGKFSTAIVADVVSVSFHKLHGPSGIGAIVCNPMVMDIIKSQPLINGAQFSGARGGTENISAIAACNVAMTKTFKNRAWKNEQLLKMKNRIVHDLVHHYNIGMFDKYPGAASDIKFIDPSTAILAQKPACEVVFLGPVDADGLPNNELTSPNTLLFSIVKYGDIKHHFCNIQLKKDLLKKGIVVSIGSACNTGSQKPSHVLYTVNAPFVIRCGVIRVSLSDLNTMRDCRQFMKYLVKSINLQL